MIVQGKTSSGVVVYYCGSRWTADRARALVFKDSSKAFWEAYRYSYSVFYLEVVVK